MKKSVAIFILMMVAAAVAGAAGKDAALTGSGKPSAAASAQVSDAGERMYRQGALPSGKPMQAIVQGDIVIEGAMATCSSCHQRSGLGSVEGGVVTPPANGSKLYQAYQVLFKGLEQKYYPIPPRRPAYTDATLAEAIRDGIDPAGRLLNDVMPRYQLGKDDMAVLITYLKALSSTFPPGVSEANIRFATVIAGDVSPEERDAMLVPLETYINIKNNQAKMYGSAAGARSRQMAENMLGSRELALRSLTLSKWLLKGAPETWQSQLEEYYRKEPVFGLLGGIATADWRPVHEFCEKHRLPALFPATDYPVISDSDWYTLYLTKGYYGEGEAAARYMNRLDDPSKTGRVIQLVRDSRQARALAAGFEKIWNETGHAVPKTVTLDAGKRLTSELLQQIIAEEKPGSLLLWDGPEALPALEALAAGGKAPAVVFISGRYMGKDLMAVGDKARAFTSITYPYRLPQDEARYTNYVDQFAIKRKFEGRAELIAKGSYALVQMLNQALMDMRGNYYRDNFFDVIGMMKDQDMPLYERLSFGPGQRYASKGCYIIQLTAGEKPGFIRKSDWVTH